MYKDHYRLMKTIQFCTMRFHETSAKFLNLLVYFVLFHIKLIDYSILFSKGKNDSNIDF